ncbi:hypothetical protein ONZ45_g8479 [Pleurotus djamor]|nr:hypothetical protein ONZ45_g8479 [Pleurotus djamor]
MTRLFSILWPWCLATGFSLTSVDVASLGLDPATTNRLNGESFQQDALVTYNGFQYAAFWQATPSNASIRHAVISRRSLDASSNDRRFESLTLTDYNQTEDDGHDIISLGISPTDGTVHLIFDQHDNPLRYRASVPGLATHPTRFEWSSRLFQPILDHLPGLESLEKSTHFINVTYPRFLRIPPKEKGKGTSLEPDLLLELRVGRSGLGDDWIYHYYPGNASSSTQQFSGRWSLVGKYLLGVNNNAYINGLDFDPLSNLHVTWTYRDFINDTGKDVAVQAGPNGPENNHDLNYAYSPDLGFTWKNTWGQVIANLHANDSTSEDVSGVSSQSELFGLSHMDDIRVGNTVQPNSPGIAVFSIPKFGGILNQESQTVDADGRVHVLNRENTTADGVERWYHYWKGTNAKGGIEWTRVPFPLSIDGDKNNVTSTPTVIEVLPGSMVCQTVMAEMLMAKFRTRHRQPKVDLDFTVTTLSDTPLSTPVEKEFNEKINASLAVMRRVCEERNQACSLTKELPKEALVMIFRIVASFPIDRLFFLEKFWSWMPPVAHVCRQWRQVALSEPSLWCDLTEARGFWLERFLNRSAALPLKIQFHVPTEPKLDALIDCPHRLRDLCIKSCTDEVIARLNKPTPHLTRLSLEGTFSIPPDFLGGDAPRLQSFSIAQGSLPLNPGWLRNIRCLKLSKYWGICPASTRGSQISPRSVLDFLRPLTLLEDLEICFQFRRDIGQAKYSNRAAAVLLPNLRHINFEFVDKTLRMMDIFNHLEVPSLNSLHVNWPIETGAVDRMDRAHKFFIKATSASLCKLKWDGSPRCCQATLTSANAEHTLRYNTVPFNPDAEPPFSDLQSIDTLEVCHFDFLSALDEAISDPPPYPSLKHVILSSSILVPKAKHIPIAKRWLKTRMTPGGVEDLVLDGLERLNDRDIVNFEKTLPVTWNKVDKRQSRFHFFITD